MLGQIGGRRRRGRQRMRWLDGITDAIDMGLSKLRELVMGQGGLACCDSWGHKESDTTERLNWTELNWTECWPEKLIPPPDSFLSWSCFFTSHSSCISFFHNMYHLLQTECVIPKICTLKSNPQYESIWKWDVWSWLGYESGGLLKGINTLVRGPEIKRPCSLEEKQWQI